MPDNDDRSALNDLRRRAIGARVAALRKLQDLTQDELAKLADTTRSAISQVENDGRNITMDTLFGIADALGVHPASLLDDRLIKLPRLPDPDRR